MTDTFIIPPEPAVKERSSFTATVKFRSSADAAEAPSTVHYRIDDLSTRSVARDWTSVSAAESVSISIESLDNKIFDHSMVRARRQLTVAADKGTTGETRDTAEWFVENIGGFEDSD